MKRLSPRPSSSRIHAQGGFTIVEVMMAAMILVVGFMGMIQAITIGSEMLATARRQTIANQIITHEIEKLRLSNWSSISGLAASSPTVPIDNQFNSAIAACGLKPSDINLARTSTDITTDLREVTFTITWNKSGSSNAASTATGSLLNQLSYSSSAPIARTYTRKMSAYFGKYGLSLNSQR